MKRTWARYYQNEDLISVGAYSRGTDAEIDRAIELLPAMRAYLQQGMQEPMPMKRAVQELMMIMQAKPEQQNKAQVQQAPAAGLRRKP